jgi:PAS domain S-box-containing protein
MADQKQETERELEFFRQTSEGLRKSLDELLALKEFTARVLTAPEEKEVIPLLFKAAGEILGAVPMVFLTYKDDLAEFVPHETAATQPALMETISKSLDQNLIRWVFSEEKPTVVPVTDEKMLTVVPISVRKIPVGLLCVDTSATTDAMSQAVFEQLGTIATNVAAALLSLRMISRLNDQYTILSNTKTYLANVLDSINNGIIALDVEMRLSQINRNATAMLDIVPPEKLSVDIAEILPEAFVAVAREMVEETLTNGFAMERMFTQRTTAGLELPLAVSTSLLRDEAGALHGVIIILRDMTASKELERLRRLDQMKSEFVSNVSHELRTPLTSIKAYTEALMDMATGDTQKEFLGVVDSESDRLLSLIEDLLNVARIESGRVSLKLATFKPHLMVEEILGVSKVQSKKHQIVREIPDNLMPIYADKDKLKEVIINLVSNAIKYSPDGGTVKITMSEQEGNLRIDVTDQGIGIAPEHLPKLFEQFYRVDSSLTYKVSGTGLGLAIVKSMVEAHGGTVRVASEVGKGSTFTVLLPIQKEPQRRAEAELQRG